MKEECYSVFFCSCSLYLVMSFTHKTTMDFDGKYSLSNVPADAVLEFSYIGFAVQRVNVNGRNQINVTLEQDTQQLDEVVVVGYGTQRREAVTGSVASIKSEAITEVP